MRPGTKALVLPLFAFFSLVGFSISPLFAAPSDPAVSPAVKTRLAALRAEGLPLSTREHLARFPAGSTNNFGRLIAALPASLRNLKGGEVTNFVSGSASALAELRAEVSASENARTLGVMKDARFEGYLPLPPIFGWHTELPHYATLKGAGTLMAMSALVKAGGEPEAALGELRQLVNLGDVLRRDRIVIGSLMGARKHLEAVRVAEHLLKTARISDESLLVLSNVFRREERYTLTNSLLMDLCVGLDTLFGDAEQLVEMMIQGAKDPTLKDPAKKAGIVEGIRASKKRGNYDRDILFFIESMREYVGADRLPYPARLVKAGEIQKKVQANAKGPDLDRKLLYSGMILPSIETAFLKHADADLRMRATTLAVAVVRYKRAQGNFPANLRQLVPEYLDAVPRDVLSDQELVFVAAPGRVGIYRPANSSDSNRRLPSGSTPLISL